MTPQNRFLSSCSSKNSPVLLAVLSTGLQVGRKRVKANKINSGKSTKNWNATLTGRRKVRMRGRLRGTLAANIDNFYVTYWEFFKNVIQNLQKKGWQRCTQPTPESNHGSLVKYFQHSKRKFLPTRGHAISSIQTEEIQIILFKKSKLRQDDHFIDISVFMFKRHIPINTARFV